MSTEQGNGRLNGNLDTSGGTPVRQTRFLSELALYVSTKSQEPQERARTTEEILKESGWIDYNLLRVYRTARPAFLDLSLTEPGIVELEDKFYTGWFYTVEDGREYSAYRNVNNVSASSYIQRKRRKPYFLLNKNEAIEWDQSIKKGSLTTHQIDELCSSPGLEAHPYYENLAEFDLETLTNIASGVIESFWNEFLRFGRDDKTSAKRELLRVNLLDLVMLQTIHRRSYLGAAKPK